MRPSGGYIFRSQLRIFIKYQRPGDRKLVEKTRCSGLFKYPKGDGVRLRCDAVIAFYLYEHQKMKKFKIEP